MKRLHSPDHAAQWLQEVAGEVDRGEATAVSVAAVAGLAIAEWRIDRAALTASQEEVARLRVVAVAARAMKAAETGLAEDRGKRPFGRRISKLYSALAALDSTDQTPGGGGAVSVVKERVLSPSPAVVCGVCRGPNVRVFVWRDHPQARQWDYYCSAHFPEHNLSGWNLEVVHPSTPPSDTDGEGERP